VMKSRHAGHLVKLGFEKDIDFSCKLNHLAIVPTYRDGKVTLTR